MKSLEPLQKSLLLENRLEHQRYFAAAKDVSFRRGHKDAASKPVLDDHVDIIHVHMTREEVDGESHQTGPRER